MRLGGLRPLLTLGIAALTSSLIALFLRLRRPRLTVSVPLPALPTAAAPVQDSSAPAAAAASEQAVPSSSPPPPIGGFHIGVRVRLTGLASKPELNGSRGCVVGHDHGKERVNVSLETGRTLQVKAANLMVATAIEELSALELCSLALTDQRALTPAHAVRVIELLGQPSSTPIEAGMLLRCCCTIGWQLLATRNKKSGKERTFRFDAPQDHEQGGTTIVLGSSVEKLEQIKKLNPPANNAVHAILSVTGKEMFNMKRLEGVGMISLDPFLGDSPETSRFTALPNAYFAPLCHMSEAMAVEASLPTIASMCPGPTPPVAPASDEQTTAEAMARAAKDFAAHTFFVFNASPDAANGTIIPVTATSMIEGKPTSWMLVYTCEMVLEQARPHLEALGAFQGLSKAMAATAVPATAILGTLAASAANSGVHINEFVPGISPTYKAVHLPTAGLQALFEAGGAGVPV